MDKPERFPYLVNEDYLLIICYYVCHGSLSAMRILGILF